MTNEKLQALLKFKLNSNNPDSFERIQATGIASSQDLLGLDYKLLAEYEQAFNEITADCNNGMSAEQAIEKLLAMQEPEHVKTPKDLLREFRL